jgi:hypothetical protein
VPIFNIDVTGTQTPDTFDNLVAPTSMSEPPQHERAYSLGILRLTG